MAVHKKQRLAHDYADSAMKENMPPKTARKTMNIGSLFDQSRIVAKHNNGITKTSAGVPHNPQSTQSKPKVYHPAFLHFADATQRYQDALGVAKRNDLQPIHDALVARVDGLTVHGKPLATPGVVTKEELEARGEEEQALCSSIDEAYVRIQERRGDDYKIKDVKVGDTLLAFERTVESVGAEVEKLIEELGGVEDEIVAAREALVNAEENEVKEADQALLEELSAVCDEINDAKKNMEADIRKARKEDHAAKAEMDSKLEQFMREL